MKCNCGKRPCHTCGTCECLTTEWINVKYKPVAKDKPILVVVNSLDFPITVVWKKIDTYKEPAFFENSNEHHIKESQISYWMYCPEKPVF